MASQFSQLRAVPLDSADGSHGLTHTQWLLITAALAVILAVIPRAAAG